MSHGPPPQALMACRHFCAVLSRLRAAASLLEPLRFPTLHGLAALAAEFEGLDGGSGSGGDDSAGTGRESAEDGLSGPGWGPVVGQDVVVGAVGWNEAS